MLFYSWFVSFRPTKDHTLHSIFVNMSLKSLLMYRLPFVSFYLSFLLNLDHWSCRIFHILDFSDCIPVVLINSISLISYKLVVISRNLISFRFDFWQEHFIDGAMNQETCLVWFLFCNSKID